MCGVGRRKTKQAGQRGTYQHSLPASHIWASRAHNKHHIAGSNPIAHQLQNHEGSTCICGVGQKKTKQAGQRGTTSMAGWQHTWNNGGHITYTAWRAASRSLTSCRIKQDPDACVVLGERKQSRLVRGAHASSIWTAISTHLSNEGT